MELFVMFNPIQVTILCLAVEMPVCLGAACDPMGMPHGTLHR